MTVTGRADGNTRSYVRAIYMIHSSNDQQNEIETYEIAGARGCLFLLWGCCTQLAVLRKEQRGAGTLSIGLD